MPNFKDMKNLALHRALGLMPTPLCSTIGAAIARRSVPKQKVSYARAAANIARLRPDLDVAGQAAMLDSAVGNLGRLMAELSRLEHYRAEKRIELVNKPNFDRVWDAGRPVIAVMLHMGNWEIVATIGHWLNLPLAVVMQPPTSAVERGIAERMRAHTGARMLPPGLGSAVEAMEILQNRSAVLGLFMDAQMLGGRVAAPALGRPLQRRNTNIAHVLRMAARTGAGIIPVLTERLPGPHFRMNVLPELELPYDQGEAAVLDVGLPLLNGLMEDWILPRLDQWLMLFRLGMGEGPAQQQGSAISS